jgi:NAD(P)-dependent dehydrogenase (short-subunit alcohol dehydrogenase family)
VQKEALRFGVRARVLQADISQTTDHVRLMESLQERFGRLDVLVNNAGVAPKVREHLVASEEF